MEDFLTTVAARFARRASLWLLGFALGVIFYALKDGMLLRGVTFLLGVLTGCIVAVFKLLVWWPLRGIAFLVKWPFVRTGYRRVL